MDESDRALRFLRVQKVAKDTFSDVDKADRWLRRPLKELRGVSPLFVVETEAGTHVVGTILANIAWGTAA